MAILHRTRPRRQRVDDDIHDPLACGLGYATDCRDCRAARDDSRTDDPSFRYSDWRWRTRQATGHDPRELDPQQREAVRNWLIDLVATAGQDRKWAMELRQLFMQALSYGRSHEARR